jgi:CheY-like chemotaxis protein
LDAQPTGLVVQADPLRLRQVLINLLGNAVKFNQPGGRVFVDARRHDGLVALRIRDDGRGIAPDRLSQVGEPFNRLGAETSGIEGTGIGLSIVIALVEAMGGRLTLDSAPGRGTVVEVLLQPADAIGGLARADAESAPAASAEAALPSAPPTRLLYIEDNPVNVLLVEEYLRSSTGYEISSAATGERGVAQALRDRPDLVLVDMQLPDFDGFEVLRRLRADERTRAIPCVALSANAMPEDIERALATGFDAYWTKPIDFRAFSASLRSLLESSRRATPAGRRA